MYDKKTHTHVMYISDHKDIYCPNKCILSDFEYKNNVHGYKNV